MRKLSNGLSKPRLTQLSSALLLFSALVLSGLAHADGHFQELVNRAHAQFKDLKEGENADYIPILASIDSELFEVAIAIVDGKAEHAWRRPVVGEM